MKNPIIEKSVNMPRFSFDVSCFRDCDLSRWWYDDFINNAGGDCPVLRLKDDFYVVGDYELPYFKKSTLSKMKKSELVELADDFLNYDYWQCDYSELKKDDIIADLLGFTIGDYFRHNVSESRWHDRDYTFIARGYSQGDAVQVALLPDAPKWVTCDYIENLIFNAPVVCRATVTDNATGEEYDFYLEEYLSDNYDYKEAELLEGMKKEAELDFPEYADLIVENIKSLLPNYPDYK